MKTGRDKPASRMTIRIRTCRHLMGVFCRGDCVKATKMFASVLAIAVVLSGAAEAASILSHGLNNTTEPDSVNAFLTYNTLAAPTGYNSIANASGPALEGTHKGQWLGGDVVNTSNPGVDQIMFSFSLAPDPGAEITLDATDSVTWVLGAGTTGSASPIDVGIIATSLCLSTPVFPCHRSPWGVGGSDRCGRRRQS